MSTVNCHNSIFQIYESTKQAWLNTKFAHPGPSRSLQLPTILTFIVVCQLKTTLPLSVHEIKRIPLSRPIKLNGGRKSVTQLKKMCSYNSCVSNIVEWGKKIINEHKGYIFYIELKPPIHSPTEVGLQLLRKVSEPHRLNIHRQSSISRLNCKRICLSKDVFNIKINERVEHKRNI